MKRIFLPFLLAVSALLFSAGSNAQFVTYENDSGISLGLNVGGCYQQSDLKAKAGVGFGATFGVRLYRRENSFFSVEGRFRYLWANNYGLGTTRKYGLDNNEALNGTADPSLNYSTTPGYAFENYHMELNDFSLELVLTLNRLREQTGIVMQGFGGIGLTQYKVFTDQLNEDTLSFFSTPYSYNTINTSASAATIETQLESMWDGNYETRADGNQSTSVGLMPHLGAALGYQFTPHFYLGVEHRVSFALNDKIDGVLWDDNNQALSSNDRYHYTALVFRWNLGGGGGTAYNPPDNNNNWTTNPDPQPDPIEPVVTVRKPVVNITDPLNSPHHTTSSIHVLRASVFYVDGRENITFKQNGNISSDFTYNPATNEFISSVNLQSGSNVFEITGTNSAGSDYESRIIVYDEPEAIGAPPIVTIINPPYSPYNTTNSVFTVNATVLNVADATGITFKINGVESGVFSYGVGTSLFSATISLNEGNNVVEIKGTNAYGTDSEFATIVYNPIEVTPPPVVNITSPVSDPYSTNNNEITIQATVLNVASSSDITLTMNGVSQSFFSFSPYTNFLEFTTDQLVEGANVIQITGINSAGSDSDDITIVYEKPKSELPPNVIITIPHNNPHTVNDPNFTVKAIIEHVKTPAGVTCWINGISTTAFSFDGVTYLFSVPVALIEGANIVQVMGTNNAGTDSESTTIIYVKEEDPCDNPIITLSQPSTDPYTTSVSSITISASMFNVPASSNITFKLNGVATTFSYNPLTGVFMSTQNLIEGANVFEIIAKNECGTTSQTTTVFYEVAEVLPPPEITFTNPSTFPHTSPTESITVLGTVLNVASQSDITVAFNGTYISGFTYSTSTKQISIPLTLNAGANTLKVTAVNTVGTDMESVVINYMPLDPPVITREVPSTNLFSTNNSTEPVQFTVTNITGPSDVQIVQNGTTITGYTYDAGPIRFTFTAYLVDGANHFNITATNSVGMDTESFQINYDNDAEWDTGEDGPTEPPTVVITSPAGNPFTTSSPSLTVIAETENATSVQVIVNGISTTSYSFDGTNVTIPVALNPGINKVSVRAINDHGYADALSKIDYIPLTDPDDDDDELRPWDRLDDNNGGDEDPNPRGDGNDSNPRSDDNNNTPTITTPVTPDPDKGGGNVTPTITVPVTPEPDKGGGSTTTPDRGGNTTPSNTEEEEEEPSRGGGGSVVNPNRGGM